MALTPEDMLRQPQPAPAPAPAEDDGRIPRTVRLKPVHDAYLRARADRTGVTPEHALETILREAKRDDPFAAGGNTAPQGPGWPAGTSRRR